MQMEEKASQTIVGFLLVYGYLRLSKFFKEKIEFKKSHDSAKLKQIINNNI